MMDRRTQEEVTRRLKASGVYLVARHSEGGNVRRTVELDWGAALVRIEQLTGWGVRLDTEPGPTVLSIVRDDDEGQYLADHAEAGSRRPGPEPNNERR